MEKYKNIPAAILLALLGLSARCLFAQSLPFEDKAKYEKTLEQKVDEVLVKILGPNQAKVIVETTMDFSRTENLVVSSKVTADTDNAFKDYLVPGFPAFGNTGTESKSYSREMLYPSAFVKKMTVSVILNRAIPDQDGANIRNVVSEILMLDAKRGDQLSVIKAPFAPIWRTIWYTPEAISMVLKYVMLSLMGIIAMIVVAVGFLKLAGAMSTMAKVQQSHQITMELGKSGAPGGMDAALPAPGMQDGGRQAAGGGTGPAGGEEGKIVFNIRLEQVPFLINMMASEDPANVALVSGHLPQEVQSEFLKKLPPPFASEVIMNMSKIRFVEPEIITTLKDELERRLSGAVGGLDGVLSAIESVNLRTKRSMLAELEQKHPELAVEVRKRILMPDALSLLSEKDLSLMVSAVKIEEWSYALLELPDEVRRKIKGQMAEKTWQMIEQSMTYGTPSAEKTEEAVEGVMLKTAELIKEGRIADPLAGARLIANDQPAA